MEMDPVKDPRTLGFSPDRLARIRPWMARYVDAGKLPGAATYIARRGKVAYFDCLGARDVESGTPWTPDTIIRIYSMTKPIVSVGLMMLYEQGLFHLDDPVDAYIPEFKDLRALRADARSIDEVEPLDRPLTIHHLLTHTAGFTYGFNGDLLGSAYDTHKVGFGPRSGGLDAMIERLATMPLAFQPGERWNYGVSTDVVGRLVEVISGEPLDRYLDSEVFAPLGMTETGFSVGDDQLGRFATLYEYDGAAGMRLLETAETSAFRTDQVSTFSGGGGLCSTMHDYTRFAEMLRRGGELDGERLVGPRTLSFMTRNHLPGDLASMGQPVFAETSFAGIGFGLGFSVTLEAEKAQVVGSAGDFGWGGMASTTFIVDPVEDMVAIFFTQLVPSSTYPLRKELRALVHQALID
jgi:CubicO group peptidase (beta-lactamase class C family)